MRALMVGLLAAFGTMLGGTEPIAAQAQGRSAVQVDYKQDAFTGQDRYRGTEVEHYAYDDGRDDRRDVREDDWRSVGTATASGLGAERTMRCAKRTTTC